MTLPDPINVVGVAATSKAGMKVIPLSLLTRFLVTLIPDGKHAPLTPNAGKLAQTQTLTELFDLLAAGKLQTVVAERIPLVEAARAHELLDGADTPARWFSSPAHSRELGILGAGNRPGAALQQRDLPGP